MYSGIDVVDIERFSDRIEANAALMQRLFSAGELDSCKGALPSLAARFCAKEAALKVLGQADVVARAACFGSGDGAGVAGEGFVPAGLGAPTDQSSNRANQVSGLAGLNFRDIEVTSRPGQAPPNASTRPGGGVGAAFRAAQLASEPSPRQSSHGPSLG